MIFSGSGAINYNMGNRETVLFWENIISNHMKFLNNTKSVQNNIFREQTIRFKLKLIILYWTSFLYREWIFIILIIINKINSYKYFSTYYYRKFYLTAHQILKERKISNKNFCISIESCTKNECEPKFYKWITFS